MQGRLTSYCHWHEFASSARALFRIADALVDRSLSYGFDDDGMCVANDVYSAISDVVCDDRGDSLPTGDPVVRQVARYIAAVNERMYPPTQPLTLIPNYPVEAQS